MATCTCCHDKDNFPKGLLEFSTASFDCELYELHWCPCTFLRSLTRCFARKGLPIEVSWDKLGLVWYSALVFRTDGCQGISFLSRFQMLTFGHTCFQGARQACLRHVRKSLRKNLFQLPLHWSSFYSQKFQFSQQ